MDYESRYGSRYDDDDQPAEAPPVVMWSKVYATLMAVMYACVAAGSVLFMIKGEDDQTITWFFMFILSVPTCIVFVVPLFVSPQPWVWTYTIVLICLGMTSVCCLPATLPLLIYWLKPEVKRHFGKT